MTDTFNLSRTIAQPKPAKSYWFRFSARIDLVTEQWDYDVRPDIPTIESVFGLPASSDNLSLAEKLAAAHTISKAVTYDQERFLIVWTKRPSFHQLSHQGDGVIIDGQQVPH